MTPPGTNQKGQEIQEETATREEQSPFATRFQTEEPGMRNPLSPRAFEPRTIERANETAERETIPRFDQNEALRFLFIISRGSPFFWGALFSFEFKS